MSGGGSSSSDEDDEMLQMFFASAARAQNSIELLLEEMNDDDDDSEEGWGGSRPGRAKNKARDFAGAYQRLVHNYFSGPASKYDENDFERRFRMPRSVFNKIQEKIIGKGLFEHRKMNLSGRKGIHPLVRLTACLRRLAYGDSSDREDENLEIAKSTVDESLKCFNRLMKNEFGAHYLNRCPSPAEIRRSVTINSGRGFPGMFASWDCKHFSWKNCPVALAGQHKGKENDKTLILEAIADPDLYIWGCTFWSMAFIQNMPFSSTRSSILRPKWRNTLRHAKKLVAKILKGLLVYWSNNSRFYSVLSRTGFGLTSWI
jgi:hypothetical protein